MFKTRKNSVAIAAATVILLGAAFLRAETGKDIRYLGINYRDPFLSFIPEEKREVKEEKITPPALNLQGIVWGNAPPRAIVNNTVLGKDDMILGAKIMDIRKDGVEFVYKGKNFIIERSGLIKEK